MKLKLLAKTGAYLMTLLAIKELPLNAEGNELELTAEQKKAIEKELGADLTAEVIQGIGVELKALNNEHLSLKAIQDEISALVKEHQIDLKQNANGGTEATEQGPDVLAALEQIKVKMSERNEEIKTLLKRAAVDTPEAILKTTPNAIVKHSQTHLFSSNLEFDAFENRNWNMRAAGLTTVATNFTDSTTIGKLNGDLDLYFRQNPEEIKSLHRDNFGLPEFWPKKLKVDDQIASGTIVTAEVSQARKLPWLPKNKQKIDAEVGKIFPIQIDIEYVGAFLQKIESSWLNMMNKEGSQPYKESFVRFLVSEIDKKARVEDRIATINGVYVKTPDDATTAPRFINRQDGLLNLALQARDVNKKYRAFDLGLPTNTNIVDYVDAFINRLPLDVKNQTGLVYYLSPEWLKAYKRRYEAIHGTYQDYSGYPINPKDYPNIKFQEIVDFSGSDFMLITFDDNIEILENIPLEKSLYKFEYLKRIIYIWADYKLGVRLVHIGSKIKAGDPLEFQVQTVWSNNVPVFKKDITAPFYNNEEGELNLHFTRLVADAGVKTAITKFTGGGEKQVIRIVGNTALANDVNITTDTGISSDFNLKSGGTLTVFVNGDGTYSELARTTSPETSTIDSVEITSGLLDANEGVEFKNATGASIAISGVENGVEGKTIKVNGPNITLSTTGNVKVTANASLANAASFVQLTMVEGKWIETKRLIQA